MAAGLGAAWHGPRHLRRVHADAASRSSATRAASSAARSSGRRSWATSSTPARSSSSSCSGAADDGAIEPLPHDQAGYFDFSTDLAQEIRQDMVDALEAFGIRVEAAHHEVAVGQHEIDFEYADALRDRRQRDHLQVRAQGDRPAARPVRDVHAQADPRDQRLRACTPTSRLYSIADERNAFADATNPYGLSDVARSYMAGILAHARGMIAVLAPLVNSYKRLVPGLRGADLPHLGPDEPLGADPRADGLARQVDRGHPRRGPLPGPVVEHVPRVRGDDRRRPRRRRAGHAARPSPVEESLFEMDAATIAAKGIRELPGTLGEALDELEARRRSSARRSATTSSATTSRPSGPSGTSTGRRSRDWEVDRYLEQF